MVKKTAASLDCIQPLCEMVPQSEDATIIAGGKKNAMDASAKGKGPGLSYVVKGGVEVETRYLTLSASPR